MTTVAQNTPTKSCLDVLWAKQLLCKQRTGPAAGERHHVESAFRRAPSPCAGGGLVDRVGHEGHDTEDQIRDEQQRLDAHREPEVDADADECRNGQCACQCPPCRRLLASRRPVLATNRVLNGTGALLPVRPLFDFKGQLLAGGRASRARRKGLDMDEEFLAALIRLDEAEATFVVPALELAGEAHVVHARVA